MSVKIEQLVAMRLNSYFKNQPVTPALTELKTELATDLNEAANDKNQSGLDPEAAVAEAFSDFGDINELIKQINAENGTTKTIHGHHVVMDDDSLSVDDGETLMINSAGIYLKGGKAFKADAEGVSINNGAIKADSHGLKLGSWTFDENGVNLNGNAQDQPDFEAGVHPIDVTAEYSENLPLVNEQRFDASAVQQLTIDYKSARVKLLPTTTAGNEIIIREYMNHNNTAYQAMIEQSEAVLRVTQGKVPFLIPVRVHVQVLIPVQFLGNLAVNNHAGNVLIAGIPQLNVVNLKVQSGGVRLVGLHAQALSMEVNSGSCELAQVQVTEQLGMLVKSGRLRLAQVQAGRFTVSAVSGTITGKALAGGGSWTVKSGAMRLDFAKVTGDTNLSAKSGSIKIGMPAEASYRYELEAHSGRIVAPRNGQVAHDADGYQAGQVGPTGQYLIQGHTVSGTLRFI